MPQPSENELAKRFLESFDPDDRAREVRRQAIEEVAEWLARDRGALALAALVREHFLTPTNEKGTP